MKKIYQNVRKWVHKCINNITKLDMVIANNVHTSTM